VTPSIVATATSGTGEASLSTQLARERTRAAVERTRLAYERTLMAWVRTAASLISFGFTIYKFFQYLHESGGRGAVPRLLGAREFALVMMATGLITLVLATYQHQQGMKVMRAQYPDLPVSVAGWLATFVACLGILGLVLATLRQ
jgi:putative membrane protein